MQNPVETHSIIYQNEGVKVEIINSFGWHSPQNQWFDQDDDETVFVIKGSAIIELKQQKIKLNTGESLVLKAHQKHRVDFTSPDCVWLCVFISNKK